MTEANSTLPSCDAPIPEWIDWCTNMLRDHATSISHDPQTNSVKQLAFDLSSGQERGNVTTDVLEKMIRKLNHDALLKRIGHLRNLHGTLESGSCHTGFRARLEELAAKGWDVFSARIERNAAGIVFTAHPTFSLSEELYGLVADYIVSGDEDERETICRRMAGLRHLPDPTISLFDEHRQVQKAIERAQGAFRTLYAEVLEVARQAFPDKWQSLRPRLMTLASWVGYDLDGRKDIHWGQTIRLRLDEKALQLYRYAATMDELAAKVPGAERLALRLADAAACTAQEAEAFAGDLNDADVVVAAANLLTGPDERRIVSLTPVIEEISSLIDKCDGDTERGALILLRAEMESYGLGSALIHLRVNASQVRTVIRHDLEIDPEGHGFGRLALAKAAEEARAAKARSVNFASIFLEQMTVRRQLMLCAQLIKHVDANAPIRFLIAECEHPATIMGAIYLARLYGVSRHLDISPLFETPSAMERGGRFMEQLIAEPEYREYVKSRGRIAIQLGFSDSGRFIGQIPAELAIERVQVLLARAIAKEAKSSDPDLLGLDVVIFNTHGESMGRGAHPSSFTARLDHLLTPWVRSRYAREGIGLIHEESYQGGDGFLHFATPELALSTATCFAAHALAEPVKDDSDRFYSDLNFSWDFYRAAKDWQEGLFENHDYRVALSGFGPNLLSKTGSRKTRRQTGAAAGTAGPSALRAIPHNAILQQLAVPVNVCGGIGTSAAPERDRFITMIKESPRARGFLRLAARSRQVTSLPVLRAYASLYDSSFWMARSLWAKRLESVREAAAALSQHTFDNPVYTSLTRLATYLASDLSAFDRILAEVEDVPSDEERREARQELHVLHAVRIALMMRSFLLIAKLPDFSKRHDVSRDDIIALVLNMQIDEAVEILDRIFPAKHAGAEALGGITEPADEAGEGSGYPRIQADIIRPLERLHALIREAGIGLSHAYGAYG